jgi:CheY-like chemotaxis protein
MNAVIGITSFLIDENPSIKQLENLKLLKYSGENLLTIINDILDFSKIEAGKMDLEETSFDLFELLQNIISMMRHKAREKNLELLLIHDKTLPQYVIGDSARINQILINLLGNAIKFTESGRVELEIQTKKLTDNKYDLTFSVTDTGIGIEHDKIELIFESFSQANKDTSRKFGGTGLGLAITKKLVNLMGGDISLISELGAGSKFYFTLTLKSGEDKKEAQPQLETITRKSDQAFNILIVEDNRVNQIVVSNYLKKWGLNYTYANDGQEALQKIISKSYHLVLMDIQMPGINGYEATKTIRSYEDPYFKNIPIIALTASVLMDKKTEIVDIGFNDFISKPFNPEELNQKIFSYLKELAIKS